MQEHIFTKKFILVFLSLLTQAIVLYILMTTISEYATGLGASITIAGLISGIYIFGGLCSRIFAGRTLEVIGWKKMALLSSWIHFLACAGYFLADNIVLLLIIRFIHGLGFGAASSSVATIGRGILPKHRFAEACGYLMLSTTLAVGIGPFIGGSVYNHFGANGCFVTAMIMSFLSLLFIYFVDVSQIDPAIQKQNQKKSNKDISVTGLQRFIEIKALPLSTVAALTGLGYVGVVVFGRLFANQMNLMGSFKYFFLIYGMVLLFSRPFAGKLQDRYGNKIVCYPAIALQIIGLFLISFFPSNISVIILAICCALGYGTIISAGNAAVCRVSSTKRLSYTISTYYMFCDIGIGFGPALLGLLVNDHSGYQTMFMGSACFTILAFLFCIIALKNQK